MNEQLSKTGQAVRDTRKRRRPENKAASESTEKRTRKSAGDGSEKAGKRDRADYRKAMEDIGKVINGSMNNLAGELRNLNADKDIDGAAEVIGRGATLCVIAQVFDALQDLISQESPVDVDRLGKVSRIITDQRRVDQRVPAAGAHRVQTGGHEEKPTLDRNRLATLVREVYGVHLAPDVKPVDADGPDDRRDDTGPDSSMRVAKSG